MTKALKKLKQIITSRVMAVSLLLILQIAVIILMIVKLSKYFAFVYMCFMLLSLAVFLYVINKNDNPSYKLAWAVPIMIFPLFGGIFYLLLGSHKVNKYLLKRIADINVETHEIMINDLESATNLMEKDYEAYRQSSYLKNMGFPVYENTETTFHPTGESKFNSLMKRLSNAKKYIFLEYFIIEGGYMWDSILEVLERKAKEGVEVRVMYDSVGCLLTLPEKYYETLRKKGIKCIEFNPLIPVVTLLMNNRDHRKIAVIDGEYGFMGGINLADEYINLYEKHGHWKDAALEIHGDAVKSLTCMFLSMWQSVTGKRENYLKYTSETRPVLEARGFVQPYCDSPLDDDLVGEMTYLNMINRADKYIYITTPYLIIDNESITALSLAAKSGVDVRIITPHVPDKWYVHMVSRAYYSQLVNNGVKIYEYTPGFIHAKTFVADDEIATVGTVNLDYRSLYLHFECGIWMFKTPVIRDMKADFLKTLEVCMPITPDSPILKVRGFKKLLRAILRMFAPLM